MNPIEEKFLRKACPHLFRHIDKPKGFPESEKAYYEKNTLAFLNGRKPFPSRLPMKSTPWTNENGSMRFGHMRKGEPLTVYLESGGSEVFKNQKELINRWTVD